MPGPQFEVGKLIGYFTNRQLEDQSSGWAELWDTNQSELWDRGRPSPALIELVETRPDLLPRVTGKTRPRALIPGCGKGYDVVMLALHGFDVVGLEVSRVAVKTAQAYAAGEMAEPRTHNYGNRDDPAVREPGRVTFVERDFFDKGWETALLDGAEGFDLIYDYTFLCAIRPEMREGWARRMRQLLAPDGVLVCVEFPLHKDLKHPGPPWPLQGAYWNLLAEGGNGIVHVLRDEKAGRGNGAFTRVERFKPRESYPEGQGQDMVSVWSLKKGA